LRYRKASRENEPPVYARRRNNDNNNMHKKFLRTFTSSLGKKNALDVKKNILIEVKSLIKRKSINILKT
jgi:hypothetical protein